MYVDCIQDSWVESILSTQRIVETIDMKFGLLVVLAVAVLVPSLSEGRIVSRCELKEKLGQAITLPPRLQKFKQQYLAIVICEVNSRSRLNTGLVKVFGKRRTTTTAKPTTTVTTQPTTTQTTTTQPTTTHPTNNHPNNYHPTNYHCSNNHPTNNHPNDYQPTDYHCSNNHPTNNHPTDYHCSNNHPTNNHPTDYHCSNNHPTNNHPTDYHCSNNHPNNHRRNRSWQQKKA
ncbi:GATA zinc finger domain-containing protein 14-like [Perca flavescens]|uniref:GATA zinc finger domain-containing protein 14-like n=1 Tax=Perca flavescens TaxID=8167 RepID=UPI00106E867C|nr:GATA zinc finger domain-containing protein 14-like [Perca flavescens]